MIFCETIYVFPMWKLVVKLEKIRKNTATVG